MIGANYLFPRRAPKVNTISSLLPAFVCMQEIPPIRSHDCKKWRIGPHANPRSTVDLHLVDRRMAAWIPVMMIFGGSVRGRCAVTYTMRLVSRLISHHESSAAAASAAVASLSAERNRRMVVKVHNDFKIYRAGSRRHCPCPIVLCRTYRSNELIWTVSKTIEHTFSLSVCLWTEKRPWL